MPDAIIQQIKDRLDIVEVISSYLKLEKTGINFRAPCPFHQEKKPSFFVSPARQMFKCFGCGASGSVFDFVMKMEGIEFPEALKLLANKAGIALPQYQPHLRSERTLLLEICELATRFFEKQLQSTAWGKHCQQYLQKRGLSEQTIKQWRLGYAPAQWRALSDFLISRGYQKNDILKCGLAVQQEQNKNFYDRFRHRIVFPVFNHNGEVIGFGARKIDFAPLDVNTTKAQNDDQSPKYINTPATVLYDKGRVLYGMHLAKTAIHQKDFCILTEGYMDVILSHQAGFTNTVSASGTALTAAQLQIIKRHTVNLYLAFDRDTAGSLATMRGIDLAQKEDFNIKIILTPNDKDPADIISENVSAWHSFVGQAKDIIAFYFDEAFSKFDCQSAQGKKEIAMFLLPYIKKISNRIVQSHWLDVLAQRLNVSPQAILEEWNKISLVDNHTHHYADHQGQANNSGQTAEALSALSKQKNRFDLLQEKILTLIFKQPSCLQNISEKDFYLFSPALQSVFNLLKEKNYSIAPSLGKEILDLAQDEQTKTILCDCLFGAEMEETADVSQEMNLCLQNLRFLVWQQELKHYSEQLKTAEREGDLQKKNELAEKINFLTKNKPVVF